MSANRPNRKSFTFVANDGPHREALGFRAYGVSVSNLSSRWLSLPNVDQFIAPTSRGTFSLDGTEDAIFQWAAPPGVAQPGAVVGQVAVMAFTEESLPDAGGPIIGTQVAAQMTLERFAKANIPAAGNAGRLIELTDYDRGIWVDDGTRFVGLGGEIFNVKAYGALGDGVVDDSTAIAAAITAASAVVTPGTSGATVYFPPGTYLVSAQLTIPAQIRLLGAGMRASLIKSSFAGYTLLIGSSTAALAYGNAVESLSILLTNTAGGAMQVNGTSGFALRDIYIEGVVSGGCNGIFINGANASNIFTVISNVICNHLKIGLRLGNTGGPGTNMTSLTALGFNAFCDLVAGGVGIQIDASNGNGSRFFGGNLENCATAILLNGQNVNFFGMRFENNTADITIGTLASGNSFIACIDLTLAKVTDPGGSGYNANSFLANTSATATPSPYPHRLRGALTLEAFALADTPLNVLGFPGQTTQLLESIRNSSNTVLRSLNGLGDEAITGKWGANGAAPQAKAAVNAASTDLASVIALCNQLRAALIANGITV